MVPQKLFSKGAPYNFNDILILISEVAATNDDAAKGTAGVVTCVISGITEAVTVVFNDGTSDIATVGSVTTVDPGTLAVGATSQTATLTVHDVQADAAYTCKVTSGQYSDSGAQDTLVSITMLGKSIF